MRRDSQRRFLAAILFLLAALLMIMTLSAQIRLCAAEYELRALKDQRDALAREKRILTVRLEGRLSLSELERRATEELNMRPCRADQIREIGIDEETDAYR